jgi:O-antigen/teichoic acid export membrane protein
LLRNIVYYFVGTLLIRSGSIILLPVFTRNLNPAEYGTLELLGRATDVLSLCLFINGLSVAAIALYNQARSDHARRQAVGSVLVLSCALTGIIGLAAFTLAKPIGVLIGVQSPGLVRLAFLAALADGLLGVSLSLIQARVEAIRQMAVSIVHLLLRLLLVVAFVCLLGWGVKGVLLAALMASAILVPVLVVVEVRRFGIAFDRDTISELARFAVPFFPGGLCGFLLGTGDQVILTQYATTAEIGLYALGYKLAMMASTFARDPLMKVWGSKMHHVVSEPNASRTFGQVFTGFTAAYLLAGLGLALFGQEVVTLLGHSRYSGAAAYIPPIVLAYFFLGGSDLMDAAFYVRRRSYIKLWITLASTTAMVALYLLLIPNYRAIGAAYATLAGFIFRLALTYVVSQRFLRVAYEWDRVVTMSAVALGCWCLGQFVTGPAWVAISTKSMIFFLFPSILWLSGLVSPEEKRGFSNLIQRAREGLREVAILGSRTRPSGVMQPVAVPEQVCD